MNVKVCDLSSDSFDTDFVKSIKETGFAVLTNHGIREDFIREIQMAWRLFFLSDKANKEHFINAGDPNMGYKGYKSEKAVGAAKADLKEFYHWKPGQSVPNDVSGLTAEMFVGLETISNKLLWALDKDFGYEVPVFSRAAYSSNNTILRSLYYPALDFATEPGSERAAAHEDINFITLLVAASSGGLQVKDTEGNWHDVPHKENSIVVNIGDMLQLASGGRYRSTTHRVINPDSSTADRVSMPMFIHPSSETVLAPGITAQQFLEQRLAEIYQKTKG